MSLTTVTPPSVRRLIPSTTDRLSTDITTGNPRSTAAHVQATRAMRTDRHTANTRRSSTTTTQPYWVEAGADTVISAVWKPAVTHRQATITVGSGLLSADTSRTMVLPTLSYRAEGSADTRTLAVATSAFTTPPSNVDSHPKTALAFSKKMPAPTYVSAFGSATTGTSLRSSTSRVKISEKIIEDLPASTTKVSTTLAEEPTESTGHRAAESTTISSYNQNDLWIPLDCFTHRSEKKPLYIQALIRQGEFEQKFH